MLSFAVGIFSVVGALFLLACYGGNMATRKLVAWVKNEDTEIKEKVWFVSILMIVLGFVFGSFIQGYWNELQPCVQYLGDVKKCIFSFKQPNSY
ncbi:hypothetical protein [Acinetobacter baumannii]|uniref:hypothetical protein n=1 Tax=Acinetobacter baumannii TaxID=470 RepID=UPI002223A51A|nr:hypothetical protein [Acinetobacter baumannii]MCW1473921.1 hypothetical protein [Acinetobacter baumannii]MDV7431418.1 hypothetical protein [Acinetobacter baumannii]